MDKGDILKAEAVGLGLCEKWRDEWQAGLDDGMLVEKFKDGIDFCILHDWPSCAWVKEHFDAGLLADHGVFVDSSLDGGTVEHTTYGYNFVLMGSCRGVLRFGGFYVATVYVRHQCDVEIDVGGLACVDVRVYDDAHVVVSGDSARAVRVYVYDAGSCSSRGNVGVHHRGSFKDLADE